MVTGYALAPRPLQVRWNPCRLDAILALAALGDWPGHHDRREAALEITPLKSLARGLALTSLGASILTYHRVRSGALDPTLLLYAGKLFAQAAAPVLAVGGATGALIGSAKRDRLAAMAGGLGALALTTYVSAVAAPHRGFTQAFGPRWQEQIPPSIASRLMRRRWSWVMPAPPRPRRETNLPFWTVADGQQQLLCDLWQPHPGTAPSGLGIIYLHGGGWQNFNKDCGTRLLFSYLAGQGHVVMDVAYRLCHDADMFEMVGDVKRALVWLKDNAARLGVDARRIVLMGGSAGGHLALLAGYTPNHPLLDPPDLAGADTSVRGVVSLYGPTELLAFFAAQEHPDWSLFVHIGRAVGIVTRKTYLRWPDLERCLLGARAHHVEETARLFSPLQQVGPHCPPTLLIHGTQDRIVPVQQGRHLYRALRQAGVPAVYLELPWVDHVFDLFLPRVSPSAQSVLYDIERFLGLMCDPAASTGG